MRSRTFQREGVAQAEVENAIFVQEFPLRTKQLELKCRGTMETWREVLFGEDVITSLRRLSFIGQEMGSQVIWEY